VTFVVVFHSVLGGPSTFGANMYTQVFQARTPIILVCVDVSPVQEEPDEPRGVMRGQRRRVYVLVYVGRTILKRAHPEDEVYICGLFYKSCLLS
jgi:hypothetical protein